jgi:MoaA/NifB/PqqE/SkfB family radical SAM enzyme
VPLGVPRASLTSRQERTGRVMAAMQIEDVSFVFLELTSQCPLVCVHCYAESSPKRGHGDMTRDDWTRVIDEAVGVGANTFMFIGGEPTRHPDFIAIARYALEKSAIVIVASGLSEPISDDLWALFQSDNVRIRTSFYSDNEEEFERITRVRGSYQQVKANIARIVASRTPLRASVVHILDGQRTIQARSLLESMGVSDIVEDRLRQVGRGAGTEPNTMFELCGECPSGLIAVLPDGKVTPCVTARWIELGNARHQSLSEIVDDSHFLQVRRDLRDHFAQHGANLSDVLICVAKDGEFDPIG